MIVYFFAPSAPFPVGGVQTHFQYANALRRHGHRVQIGHVSWDPSAPVLSPDDVSWFDFEPGIEHYFATSDVDVEAFHSDVHFGYDLPHRMGLPVLMLLGWQMLPAEKELGAIRSPGLKVCIARWLADVCRQQGVPDRQILYLPHGIDHDVFNVRTPPADRPRRVALLNHGHPNKRTALGIEVLLATKEKVPDLEAVLFGTSPRPADLPDWIDYRHGLPAERLAVEVYNECQAFVCPSYVEGFGRTALEAMACGAALVTTDNGGSREYADHGRTALVSPPDDRDALVDHLVQVINDDDLRAELIANALASIDRFDWTKSEEKLVATLVDYRENPHRYLDDDQLAALGMA